MNGYIYSPQTVMFGAPRVVGFGDDDFAVKEIDRGLANRIIQKNHYSRKFYSASYIHLGVFIAGELVGVLQFGYAMNPASQASVVAETEMDEYLELNRMWLDDVAPRNSESRALSYALKIIRAAYPKIKWIQSFADERCRLGGVVYQACNFGYFGEHTATFWELDGEIFHNSIMTESRKAETPKGRKLQSRAEDATAHSLRQFRYLYFMKPRFAKKCLHKQKPYPKIAARPADELATSQREEGATPSGRSIDSATSGGIRARSDTGNPCGQNYAAGDAAVRRSFCLYAPAVESGVPTAGAIGGAK